MAELPMRGVAQFILLLYTAEQASRRCDTFDLHSEDEASNKKWGELGADAREAMLHLVNFCADNRNGLIAEIEEVTHG